MQAKNLPVCQKGQQETMKIATQFSDDHHQMSHEGRRNDTATVETKKVSEGTLICISICPKTDVPEEKMSPKLNEISNSG